jgi:DNA-binding winged helix-turn-helix (wHTH) protein
MSGVNDHEAVESAGLVNTEAIFSASKMGMREGTPLDLPYHMAPDGSIGLSVPDIKTALCQIDDNGILWVRSQELTDDETNGRGLMWARGQQAASNANLTQPIVALEGGQVVINRDNGRLFVGDERIALGDRPFSVLAFLSTELGRVCARRAIMDNCFEGQEYYCRSIIDIQVHFIRKAFGDMYRNLLVTEKNVGFKLLPELPKSGRA